MSLLKAAHRFAAVAALTFSLSGWAASPADDAQALADYAPVTGVAGNLSSVGSDTLANLITLWGEAFRDYYPAVNVQIQGAGSSTAPPALTLGTANLGPMSRKMKDKELQDFVAQHGYEPTAIPVAIDTLAIYVHKDNPLPGLSIEQIDALFSSTRKCGQTDGVSEWGQLGLDGSWQQRDIQLFGRNSVSGTYGYFKEKALCKGDFRNSVNEQPGSASVVQAVATTINAVGYSGIGYQTASVRAVPICDCPNGRYIDATMENAIAGDYPLSRVLYLYINKAPDQALTPLLREYLRLIFSAQGQEIVRKDGYIPLPLSLQHQVSQALGL